MIRFALPAVLLIGGCVSGPELEARQAERAARNEAKLAETLAGLEPTRTTSCIDLSRMNGTEVIGDMILYRESPSRIYRTDTGGGCFSLSHDDIIVTKTFSGRLCRGDIIHTVSRASRTFSGSCSAGEFTLYTKPSEEGGTS